LDEAMKSKLGLVAATSAAGAFLAACHGDFYGGGDLRAGYVSPVARHDAAATTTASIVQSTIVQSTTAPSSVSGAATNADRP
jgi:hypothetical protein